MTIDFGRINKTMIIDYGGEILFLSNVKINCSHNKIELKFNYNQSDYDIYVRIFQNNYADQSGLVTNYKKDVRIIVDDFAILSYGAFLTSVNYNEDDNSLEVVIYHDYVQYHYDSNFYMNYLPYLRSHKIERIQVRMKKELIMN